MSQTIQPTEAPPSRRRRPLRRALRNWRERHQHPFNFAIHLNVAGHSFYGDGAVAHVQKGGSFYVFNSEIATVSRQIHVAFAL